MITIEMNTTGKDDPPEFSQDVADSSMASLVVSMALTVADHQNAPRLWIRVTGGGTAANCRHHPLAPGTIGDPRR